MNRSDYLIIGGGTAGCILAARLSEDPEATVTLLEAGPEDRDPWIHIPAGYARLFLSGRYDWKLATEPEAELGGRSIGWPRGRVLGGSGSVNGLVFLRGSPHDYDRWAQAGASGWAYDDVLPVFRRIENWQGTPSERRGVGGPITVSEPHALSAGAAAFIEAAVACGIQRHRDINADSIEGVAPIQMNVRGGFRCSTARAYLAPARRRPNLRVLTGVAVHRLTVEGGQVTGCVARQDGADQTFVAARETVLCAGAIMSPALLLRSGIGDGQALQNLGIPVALHRPAVGRNLQDHLVVRSSFRTRPAGTLNELTATRLRMARMGLGYLLRRRGPMAVGATEATLFARVTPGAEEAEIQMQFINFSLQPGRGYTLETEPGFMFNFGQCRPESRGQITLRSPDPDDKPRIQPRYLTHPTDQRAMLEGARFGQRLARTPPFADLVLRQLAPDPDAVSDADLMAYIREAASTVYHPCGTCRMGADEHAVTDNRLRLRGLAGLRIADASVMPLVPSSNIQPAVMMIAERAADFLSAA